MDGPADVLRGQECGKIPYNEVLIPPFVPCAITVTSYYFSRFMTDSSIWCFRIPPSLPCQSHLREVCRCHYRVTPGAKLFWPHLSRTTPAASREGTQGVQQSRTRARGDTVFTMIAVECGRQRRPRWPIFYGYRALDPAVKKDIRLYGLMDDSNVKCS